MRLIIHEPSGFIRKPHIFFFWRFQWNFDSISAVSRFFGGSEIETKGGFIETKGFDWEGGQVVSLKPRVSTEKEVGWFHWNQGFRLRWRPKAFFSVEYPWFQWIPPNLLLSWIPLVSMKSTCPPSQSNTLGFNEMHLYFSISDTPKNSETADILLKFR